MSWNPSANNNNGSFVDSFTNYGKPKKVTLPFSPTVNSSPESAAYSPTAVGNTSSILGGTDPTSLLTSKEPPPATGFDSLKFFGSAGQGLAGLGAMLQAYNGYKQTQLGRDTFDFQKSSYNQDSANQAKMVNSELQDRQQSRIASTGNNNANGVYDSLGSYMDRNKVSAKPL
jgi:hypothetical protein